MLPIPPLDGGRVAVGILPPFLSQSISRLEPYGMLIIIAVIFIIPVGGSYFGLNLNVFFTSSGTLNAMTEQSSVSL